MPKPVDTPFGTQRLRKRLTQNDAGILNRMVAVHMPVPYRFQFEAKASVDCKGSEHMIKKSDSRGDFDLASIEGKLQRNLCLFGFSAQRGVALHPYSPFSFR